MRKIFILLSLIILIASGCSEQPGQNFVYSPKKPQAGQEINVTYNPASTVLEKADQIEMLAYEFSTDQLPKIQQVEISKLGTSWNGSFVPDSATLLVLVKFNSEKKSDSNYPDGYKILVYDAEGNALAGVHTALANAYISGAYPLQLKRDAKKARDLIEKEFSLYPDQKDKHLNLYWSILLQADKENGKAKVIAAVDSIASKENLTLDEKKLLATFYERLQQPDKAEPFKADIRTEEPKGDLVQSERFREFYQERNLNKMIELYNEFKVNFPENNRLPYMGARVVNKFIELKRFDEAEQFLETLAAKVGSNHYNTLAWAMVENEINLQTAAHVANKGVALAREEMDAPISEKPSYFTEKEWRNQKKYPLGMVLDTYAAALYKLGQTDEALPALEEAVELTNKSQHEINERYASALLDAEENDKALQFIEGLIKDGNSSSSVKEIFKQAYMAAKKSDQGLDEALAAAEEQGLNKRKEELAEELVNIPAPDFSLTDLDGNTISLHDLKGKTVVLDFWATWCRPCLVSFPGMQQAVEKFKDTESVEFLFINTWEGGEGIEKRVADFIEQNNYTFHVLLDSENKVVEAYAVEGIPTKFVIDKQSKIRFKSVGFSGDTDKLVEKLGLMIEMVK